VDPEAGIPSFYQDLVAHARLEPGRTAVALEGLDISYARFTRDIEAVTRQLAREGLAAGTRVIVKVWPSYQHWLTLIALMRLGMPTVSIGREDASAVKAGACICAKDSDAPPDVRRIEFNDEWLQPGAADAPPLEEPRHAVDAPCRFILSSGTTGNPKAVVITFGQLRARYMLYATLGHLHAGSRLMSMMTATAVGGFTSPLGAWFRGGTTILEDVGKQRNNAALVRAHRPTVLIGSPAQLGGLLKEWPPGQPVCPQLDVHTGGSALPEQMSHQFRLRISPRLTSRYGSTETAHVAVVNAADAAGRPGFVGYPPPWVQIQVVDDHGNVLPAGETGQVRSRVAAMSEGYFEDDRATAEHFIDGWFYPGDLGTLDAHGGLTVLGRAKELLNLGGVKISPDRVDEALAGTPGVKDLASFGLAQDGTERLWVALVATPEFELAALLAEFRKKFPGLKDPFVFKMNEIPRTEIGKPMRAQLKEKLRAGLESGRLRRT